MSDKFHEIKTELKNLILADFDNLTSNNFMPFLANKRLNPKGIMQDKYPYGFAPKTQNKECYDTRREREKIIKFIDTKITTYENMKCIYLMSFTGLINGEELLIVDYDKKKETNVKPCGVDFFNNNNKLETYTNKTKSGGFHQYFKCDNPEIIKKMEKWGLDWLKCCGDIIHNTYKIVLKGYEYIDGKITNEVYKQINNKPIKYIDEETYNELLNIIEEKQAKKEVVNKQVEAVNTKNPNFYYIDNKLENLIVAIVKNLIKICGKSIVQKSTYNKILYAIKSLERKNTDTEYFYIIDYYSKQTQKLGFHSFYNYEGLLSIYKSININDIHLKLPFLEYLIKDIKHDLTKETLKMIDNLPYYKTRNYKFFTPTKYEEYYIKKSDETILSKNEEIKEKQTKKFKKYDNIIIKSQTGTGKTFFCSYLFKSLKEDNPKLKFLSLTSRRSLAYTHYTAFKNDNIDVNLYENKFYEDNLVIQLESLGHFNEENIKYYTQNTILIIDEYNSNLEHLITSDTFKANTLGTRFKIIDTYIKLIQNANKLIVLDADITDYSLKFINKYRNFTENKTIIYENTHKCCLDKEINLYSNELHLHNKLIEKILNMVDNGVKDNENKFIGFNEGLCIISDTQTQFTAYKDNIINIIKYYKEVDITPHINFYTANNGDKNTLKDVKNNWKNKINMYNQSILYGIDYTHNQAEDTFIWASGGSLRNSSTSIAQAMNRNRNIKKVYCYIPNQDIEIKYNNVKEISENLQECEEICKYIQEHAQEKKHFLNPYVNDAEDDEEEMKQMKFIYKIYSNILYKNQIINSNIKYHFIVECEKKGMIINDITEDTETNYYDDFFNGKTMNQQLNEIQNENRHERNETIKSVLHKYINAKISSCKIDEDGEKAFYKEIKEEFLKHFNINVCNEIISTLHRVKFHINPSVKYNDFFNLIVNKYEYYNTFNIMYLFVNEKTLDDNLISKINEYEKKEFFNKIVESNKAKIFYIKELLKTINSSLYNIDMDTLNNIIDYKGKTTIKENEDNINKCNDYIKILKKVFNNRMLKEFKDIHEVKRFCITAIKKIAPSIIQSKGKKHTTGLNEDKLTSIINMCVLIGSKFELECLTEEQQVKYNEYIKNKKNEYKAIY